MPETSPQSEFLFLRFDLDKDLLETMERVMCRMDKITQEELVFEYQLQDTSPAIFRQF